MSAISLVVVIGLLNLCLGYALAVALGYGAPSSEIPHPGLPADTSFELPDGEPVAAAEPLEGLIQELVSGPKTPSVAAEGEESPQDASQESAPTPGEQPEPGQQASLLDQPCGEDEQG